MNLKTVVIGSVAAVILLGIGLNVALASPVQDTQVKEVKTFDSFTAEHNQLAYCTGMVAASGKLASITGDDKATLQMYMLASVLSKKAESALPEGTSSDILEEPAKAGAATVFSTIIGDKEQMLTDFDKCEQFVK